MSIKIVLNHLTAISRNLSEQFINKILNRENGFKRNSRVVFEEKGQNYENQNFENQKEHRKPCKPSQRQKDLLKQSERRKGKRSLHRKDL